MQERYREEEGRELRAYFYLMLENRYLMLIIFLLTFFSIILMTKLSRPVYMSSSTILIESKDMGLTLFPVREMNPRQTFLNNHIEMIQSRALLERVSKAIMLPDAPESLFLRSPKFNNAQRIAYIKNNLSVIPVKDTDILKISYKDRNAFDAYYIANLIVSEYYNINLEMTRGELSEVRKFLEDQLKKMEGDLKYAEEQLKSYKERKQVVQLSEETQLLVNTLSGFQQNYKSNEIELKTLQARLNIIKDNLSESQRALADGYINTSNPFVTASLAEMDSLEKKYATYLAKGYNEKHPKIVEIVQRINNLKSQLIEAGKKMISENTDYSAAVPYSNENINEMLSLQVEIKAKESVLKAIGTVVAEYEKMLQSVPLTELDLARLERDRKVAEEIYLMLRSKYEESRVAEAGKLGAVRIIDKAVLNSKPILPRTQRNIVLGFFFALIIAVGSVFLKEYIDDNIKDVDEVEREMKIQSLGSIPFIALKENGFDKNDPLAAAREKLINKLPEGSPIIESYKMLRTNLIYYPGEKKLQMLTLSSATKGEGKSTSAINLGITLSQLKYKVLLVDADLRRPVLARLLNMNTKNKGLTNMIREDINIGEAVFQTPFENLYLMPHGERTTNSTELLESSKMQQIFTLLRENFDYILIDTSPILSIADPAIISRQTDGLLWVVQYKKVRKRDLHYAKKLLDNLNTNILGFIFNNINITSPYGRYYYYHYYHYKTKDEGEL